MCGIYGFITEEPLRSQDKRQLVMALFKKVEQRGSDGVGLLVYLDGKIETHKSFLKPSEFVEQSEMKQLMEDIVRSEKIIFILQGRLSTSGAVNLQNQHPINLGSDFLFHNGIYLRHEKVDQVNTLSDSWDFIHFLNYKKNELDHALKQLDSENSFVLLDTDKCRLFLGSNTGSMFQTVSSSEKFSIFGSEPMDEFQMFARHNLIEKQIRGVVTFNLEKTLKISEIREFEMGKSTKIEPQNACTNCGLTKSCRTLFESKSNLCLRCVEFKGGIGKNRPPIKSDSDLRRMLTKKRVVVGFSGGRDSSYALGRLSAIPGIELIAVSYDWGGITDLGRRNQSRVCGTLGIEHVWISADLESKRSNVRKNLLAWCSKPSLSTIPLMLAGDKAMWKYPLRIAEKRKADFIVFCTNPLERTDFKVSLAGVKSRSKSNRPQVINQTEKFILLTRYAFELVKNPRLINSSLWDSILGFKYYFFDSAKNIQYFDYELWNEDNVNTYLKEKFDWEFSSNRKSSWRIGDITTPFYNLAYHSSLGFTEFDTLRANQVRNNHLSIDEAKELLLDDNRADWSGLTEYSKCMGVSELTLMRGIERLTRKYKP
jgi:glucosamine--fructose-6-phosphate aminotransferase (isomerizing)